MGDISYSLPSACELSYILQNTFNINKSMIFKRAHETTTNSMKHYSQQPNCLLITGRDVSLLMGFLSQQWMNFFGTINNSCDVPQLLAPSPFIRGTATMTHISN